MKAGEVGSHAVYPLASKVALSPPEGKLEASGSPLTSSLPDDLCIVAFGKPEMILEKNVKQLDAVSSTVW